MASCNFLENIQGSRWTFQATRMNGVISGGFGIKPDQMQVVNPILVLLFIPVFDRIIYPLLAKCNLLKKPLQRLTFGLFFAGLSFVVSGIIELTLVVRSAMKRDTYAHKNAPQLSENLNIWHKIAFDIANLCR